MAQSSQEKGPNGFPYAEEVQAGAADVLKIPESLIETAYTVTGVDIRDENVRCGAEIEVVENA